MKKVKFFSFVAVAALTCGMVFTSCEKKPVDPYEGKINPSTIAQTNLVAYFPMESEAKSIEIGTGITYTKKAGAAAFTKGRRGNGYQGSQTEAYLEYALGATNPFKTMSEFTLAAWIKAPGTSSGAAQIMQMDGGDGFMGNLCFMHESQQTTDSLDLKLYILIQNHVHGKDRIFADRVNYSQVINGFTS